MRHHCACGARLRWEARQTAGGKRWFAFCASEACGRWTTQLADGPEPEDGLSRFLLDYRPLQPYVKPWVRLFLRTTDLGWSAHHASCGGCGSTLVMQLSLAPSPHSAADPKSVVLCLACGQTAIRLPALGDLGELQLGREAWENPCVAIRILKRALDDRMRGCADHDDAGDDWQGPFNF
jgi:hypothetical protein